MTSEENTGLVSLIDQLIEEANDLLRDTIEKIKLSDSRSKLQQSQWAERHRLSVLLEVAQQTRKALSQNAIVAPWFLAELKATLEVVRRWHKEPIWGEIEPSLVNPAHFTHTIAKLWIAEQLKSAGHTVRIVPRGVDASPDLKVQATGGTQDWISVECYQPLALNGGTKVSARDIEKIVKQSMKKAKRQLGNTTPGILAICGFNQPHAVVEGLKRMIMKRFEKTERLNLCGFSLVMLGIVYKRDARGRHFTPTISLDFIRNPSYFGRVEVKSEISTSDPNLIRGPLIDIRTEDLVAEKIPSVAPPAKERLQPQIERNARRTLKERLQVIEKPAEGSRAIFSYSDAKPKLIGEGNIDYLCGGCGTILVEGGWKQSFSNIVIKCPHCQSYNEFPKIDEPEIRLVGTIGFEKAEYLLTDVVWLKRGVCQIGI